MTQRRSLREGRGAFLGRPFCLVFSESPERQSAWKQAFVLNAGLAPVCVATLEQAESMARNLLLAAVLLDDLSPSLADSAVEAIFATPGARHALLAVTSPALCRVTRVPAMYRLPERLMLPVEISPARACWEVRSMLEWRAAVGHRQERRS